VVQRLIGTVGMQRAHRQVSSFANVRRSMVLNGRALHPSSGSRRRLMKRIFSAAPQLSCQFPPRRWDYTVLCGDAQTHWVQW
jgi:hypothetical protein